MIVAVPVIYFNLERETLSGIFTLSHDKSFTTKSTSKKKKQEFILARREN